MFKFKFKAFIILTLIIILTVVLAFKYFVVKYNKSISQNLEVNNCSNKVVLESDGHKYIKGSLLVLLKNNTKNSNNVIEGIASSTKAVICYRSSDLKTYTLQYNQASENELKEIRSILQKNSNVESVTYNIVFDFNNKNN